VPAPATSVSHPPTPSTPPPSGLTGSVATGGTGVEVMLATSPPTVFDSDTGTKGTVAGLPAGERVVGLRRVGEAVVITTERPCSRECGPGDVFVYDAGALTSLGEAFAVAPGADQDTVWAIREDSPESCRLEHVSLTGRPLGTGTVASCSTIVREETSRGLLITVHNGTAETTDVLIDPDTGRSVRQAPSILAAFGNRLILGGLTDLTVVDLRDGSRKKLQPPVVRTNPLVLPSRDGASVAVDFGSPAWHGSDIQTRDVWLLDLADYTWQHAPSMPYRTETLKHSSLDWSAEGDLVLDDGVVAVWHPGEPTWRLGRAELTGDLQAAAVVTS
jgi:hypothetical protein